MSMLIEEIKKLEHELHHPGVPISCERLEALLHPAFYEVGRSGVPYDRETVIRYLASQVDPPDVVVRDHRFSMLGPGSLLLTYYAANRLPDGSEERETHRSSVWVSVEGSWQLYYHQGTPASVV